VRTGSVRGGVGQPASLPRLRFEEPPTGLNGAHGHPMNHYHYKGRVMVERDDGSLRSIIALGPMAIALTGLATLLSCDTLEKKSHDRFAGDIQIASAAVQRTRQSLGQLPDDLNEDMFRTAPTDIQGLIQYRKESDSQYLLWINRNDLTNLNELPDRPTWTSSGATKGDIFARYDQDGDVIIASWDCLDCPP
jgi:hypothetical protein